MLRFRSRQRGGDAARAGPSAEQRVRQLTEQADLIVDELSEIVAQMGDLLRRKAEASDADPSP